VDDLPVAKSVFGVPIRLPAGRWKHIAEQHAEVAPFASELGRVIAEPDLVLAGLDGECLAVREQEPGKWLVVVYREEGDRDGFVITAFLTRRMRQLERRRRLWPK
jgi:hypothetical protein